MDSDGTKAGEPETRSPDDGKTPWVLNLGTREIFSLGPYSDHESQRARTLLGSMVKEYKYDPIPLKRQLAIEKRVLARAITLMRKIWPDQPFDFCVPVPSNRKNGPSLATGFSAKLSRLYPRIKDGRSALQKTREISSLKSVPKKERPRHLKDAYTFAPAVAASRGILIVDDIYDTGATLSEANRAIENCGVSMFAELPRYFIVLSHLESNKRWKKWSGHS